MPRILGYYILPSFREFIPEFSHSIKKNKLPQINGELRLQRRLYVTKDYCRKGLINMLPVITSPLFLP
jgi:hypothetical protein